MGEAATSGTTSRFVNEHGYSVTLVPQIHRIKEGCAEHGDQDCASGEEDIIF